MRAREARAAERCTRSAYHGRNANLICCAHLMPDTSARKFPTARRKVFPGRRPVKPHLGVTTRSTAANWFKVSAYTLWPHNGSGAFVTQVVARLRADAVLVALRYVL